MNLVILHCINYSVIPSCGLEMNWETLQEELICGFLKAFLVCA